MHLIDRRQFLSAAVIAPLWAAMPVDELYILPQNDIGRLKADFNANLSRIRLVFMLSPT